jgi:hypothetical protein
VIKLCHMYPDERKESMAQPHIEVANEILRQLGGNRFRAMTGARNFIADKEGRGALFFQIPRAKNGVNRVRVVLTPADEYDVTFTSVLKRKHNYTTNVVEAIQGIYADQLQEVFTRVTGLDTKLW